MSAIDRYKDRLNQTQGDDVYKDSGVKYPSTATETAANNPAETTKPKYTTTTYTKNAGNQQYVDQLNSIYNKIMNRGDFKYDLNGDLLYRQMADKYTQLGQQAMRDTMGQAASLTGGYGNSYASQVGNQAYQQYLTALNDQIPNLYDRALNTWQAQNDDLLQRYQLAASHPEYLEAIKPRTYTVKTPIEDPEEETPSNNQSTYNQPLTNPLSNAYGGVSTDLLNQLDGIVYKYLEEMNKK